MPKIQPKYSDTQATYQIKVLGRLDASRSAWFDDMAIQVTHKNGQAITTLTGPICDQAALHGILSRIRDLGLQLILVQLMPNEEPVPKENFS